MSIKLKVVKLGQSFYLRIPSAIAKLVNIQDDATFEMTFIQNGGEVSLIYKPGRGAEQA